MKRYYTTSKSGEEVEVDQALAKELVASGKKTVEDFTVEDDGDSPPSVPGAPAPTPEPAPTRNIWREGILNRQAAGASNAEMEKLFEMAKAQRRPGTEYGMEEWLRQEMADGKPLNRGVIASVASELQNLTSGARRSRLGRTVDAFRRGAAGALVNPKAVVDQMQQGGSIYDYGMKKGDEALAAANAAAIAQGQAAGPSTPITQQIAELPGQVAAGVGGMVEGIAKDPRGAIEGLVTEVLDPENYLAAGAANKAIRAAGMGLSKVPLVGRPASRLVNLAAAPNPLAEMGAVQPGVVRRTAGHLLRTVPEQVAQGAIVEAARTGDVTAAGVAANLPAAALVEGIRGAAGGPRLPRTTEPPATAEAPATPAPEATAPAPEPTATAPEVPAPEAAPAVPPQPRSPTPAPPIMVDFGKTLGAYLDDRQGLSAADIAEMNGEVPPRSHRPPAPRVPVEMRRALRRESRLEGMQQAAKAAERTRAAESTLQRARRDADRHAKGGNQEFASKIIDDAKASYEAVYGESAAQHMEADKALLAQKRKSRLPTGKPPKPATLEEASAIVEKAKETVATGTPEEAAAAVEQAKPALEALNPVGDDAKVAAAELESTTPAAPPEPATPVVETPAPAPDGYQTNSSPSALSEANARGQKWVEDDGVSSEEIDAIASSSGGIKSAINVLSGASRFRGISQKTFTQVIDRYIDKALAGPPMGALPDMHGRSFRELGAFIAANGSDATKAIATRIANIIPDGVVLSVDSGANTNFGIYFSNGPRSIIELGLPPNGYSAIDMAMHELIHATLHSLSGEAKAGLTPVMRAPGVFEALNEIGRAATALKSVDEFVAYALTDPDVQKALSGVRVGPGTAWSRFVSTVRRILGISAQHETALDSVLRVSDEEITKRESRLPPAPKPPAPDVPFVAEAKAPIPDFDVRPQMKVPSGPGKPHKYMPLPSPADWVKDPLDAAAATRDVLSNGYVARVLDEQSPRLGAELKRVLADMNDRANATVETVSGPVTAQELAEDFLVDFDGPDPAVALYDPAITAVDDYAATKGLTRSDLQDAHAAMAATPEERAIMDRVVKHFSVEDAAIPDPARTTRLGMGLGSAGDEAISWMSANLNEAYRDWFERISDEFNRLEKYAYDKGGEAAGDAMRLVNTTVRRMNSEANIKIGELMSKLDQALRVIPETNIGLKKEYLTPVADALDGREANLDPIQKQLYESLREIFDELGRGNEAAGAATMRKNYLTRVEERGLVNDAISKMEKELPQQSQDLQKGVMTVDRARGIQRPTGKAGEIVDHYSKQLQKLFILDKEGRAIPAVDENGRPLVGSESAYLLLMDPEGTLDPMLPELFRKVQKESVGPDGKLRKVYTVEPGASRTFTPEEYKALMDAEAVRLLANRADYDPDAPRESQGAINRTMSWQVDASLQRGRMLPAMPDEFYDRNPINILAHIIPRQVRGAARIATYGKDKSGMLQQLLPLTKIYDDATLGLVKNSDGTYRLAGPADRNYDRSLVRSLDDVAMGYMRPFTKDGVVGQIADGAAGIVKFMYLLGRIISAAPNELLAAGQNLALGPEAAASYASARTAVAGMQVKSRLTRLGASAVRASAKVTPRSMRGLQHRALQSLVGADPLNAADLNAMADASTLMGANRGERLYEDFVNTMGTFSGSNKAIDIAAHLSGYNMMLNMLDAANKGEADLSKLNDPITRMLRSNLDDAALGHAKTLVGNDGRPVSQQAARDLMALGNPFIADYKSLTSGNSNVLFASKMMRNRWARRAALLMQIPLSIQVGQINALRNASKPALRVAGAVSAATLAGLAVQYARANPQAAAVFAMLAAGTPGPALMTAPIGGYDPDSRYAKAQWAVTKAGLQGDLLKKLEAMAFSSANGMAWMPRGVEPGRLSDAEASLAGLRTADKSYIEKVASLAHPGIAAALQGIQQRAGDIKQAKISASQGRLGDALELATGVLLPQIREAGGKRRLGIISDNKAMDAGMTKMGEKVEALQGGAAADLLKLKLEPMTYGRNR